MHELTVTQAFNQHSSFLRSLHILQVFLPNALAAHKCYWQLVRQTTKTRPTSITLLD